MEGLAALLEGGRAVQPCAAGRGGGAAHARTHARRAHNNALGGKGEAHDAADKGGKGRTRTHKRTSRAGAVLSLSLSRQSAAP